MFDSAYRFIGEIRSIFFSEEKKQKTFVLGAAARVAPVHALASGAGIKVFWFFSSEKNALLSRF